MKQPIVLTAFTLQGGGAERFVLTLAEAFREEGFEVHIVCFKSEAAYVLPKGIYYHYLNYQPFRSLPRGQLRYRWFAAVFDRYIQKHNWTTSVNFIKSTRGRCRFAL